VLAFFRGLVTQLIGLAIRTSFFSEILTKLFFKPSSIIFKYLIQIRLKLEKKQIFIGTIFDKTFRIRVPETESWLLRIYVYGLSILNIKSVYI
jgi:hypothetical protein